ncbi:uncharacterized protein V1518DRAFT_419711 [Limtongia smithiae]|uniref:uncharacterized protein n=1 Tax=Limtongia smithiae TaxID=1125753 RepID=UPI0034CF92B0
MMVQLRRCAGKVLDDTDAPDDFARRYARYLLPDRRYRRLNEDGEVIPESHDEAAAGRSASATCSSAISPSSSSAFTPSPVPTQTSGSAARPRVPSLAGRMHLPQYAETTVGGNPLPHGCIYRRQDGILVRLVCPDCSRTTFGSAQGFINHCRISHAREFTSHDNAAQSCGTELEEEDQDDIGLGALRHRKHMMMSAAAGPSPFTDLAVKSDYAAASGIWSTPSLLHQQNAITAAAPAAAAASTSTTPPAPNASASNSNDHVPRHVPDTISPLSVTGAGDNTTIAATIAPNAVQQLDATHTQQLPLLQQSLLASPAPVAVIPSAAPPPPPPSTAHLSSLLKRKQIDVDLDHMAAESLKRDPRGHLFPGEDCVSEDEDAELAARMPSVVKFKRMVGQAQAQQRARPLGSGIRILANFN